MAIVAGVEPEEARRRVELEKWSQALLEPEDCLMRERVPRRMAKLVEELRSAIVSLHVISDEREPRDESKLLFGRDGI